MTVVILSRRHKCGDHFIALDLGEIYRCVVVALVLERFNTMFSELSAWTLHAFFGKADLF